MSDLFMSPVPLWQLYAACLVWFLATAVVTWNIARDRGRAAGERRGFDDGWNQAVDWFNLPGNRKDLHK